VLAGGTARRYGGLPKGLEAVGGRRMLDRVVDAVAAATGQPPLLVANDSGAARWRPDLRVTADVHPGCGSLGGIYTAVVSGPGPVLCVAWDMPFVTPQLLSALVAGAAGFDAFLPESGGPRGVEPLCGVYSPACAAAIALRLARGELAATAFHPDVAVGILPLERVRAMGSSQWLFYNVNRPADLARAEALWRQLQHRRLTHGSRADDVSRG
jgi:molybdopterin-guanine dinucleotide biosynthesis protein A